MNEVFGGAATYLENPDGIFSTSAVDGLMELRLCYRGGEEVDG